ncbi:hypothetical protein ACTXT7_004471 [Hymenolepis weldensis]
MPCLSIDQYVAKTMWTLVSTQSGLIKSTWEKVGQDILNFKVPCCLERYDHLVYNIFIALNTA